MKILVPVVGVIGLLSLFFGFVFKILHLPGADEMLFLAPVWIAIVFIPLALIQRYRKKSS
jgi:hypothetical protein